MTDDVPSGTASPDDFSDVRFVFLDRDGVINRKAPSGAYVVSWEQFEILPGVNRAIACLNQAQRKVIVVTNQRGVALGRMSESDLMSLHEKLNIHLASYDAHLDSIYYCPHDVGGCQCRKPAIGLFQQAFNDFPDARPGNSVMLGDSYSDMLAGVTAGMKTILITEMAHPDVRALGLANARARSLLEAVSKYLLK